MLILLWLLLLPSCRAEVDCRMACTHCRDEAEEASLVEVYCAMCRECRERRKERKRNMEALTLSKVYGWEEDEQQPIPPGCPTAAPCLEEVDRLTNKEPPEPAMTTCVTPAPTTCPPVIPCNVKQLKRTTTTTTPAPPSSFPMMVMPMCCMGCPVSCPNVGATPTQDGVQKLKNRQPTTKDFFYVYIGLPKDALNTLDK